MRTNAVSLLLLFSCLLTQAQTTPSTIELLPAAKKSALGRRGLHHASITGRFVRPDGKPEPGVRVHLTGPGPRSLPVAGAVTDSDGRFRLADVNTSHVPGLGWHGSPGWLNGAMAVLGESGEAIDVGEIKLAPNVEVWVALDIAGGDGQKTDHIGAVITTSGGNPFQRPRIVGTQKDGMWHFTQVPMTEGTWEISLYYSKGKEYFSEVYSAPVQFEPGRRNAFRLKLDRDSVRVARGLVKEGRMEATPVEAPAAEAKAGMRWRGTLVAPDGTPLPGAVVGAGSTPLFPREGIWAFTDEEGRFDFYMADGECSNLPFALGQSEPESPEVYNWKDKDQQKCRDLWKDPVGVSPKLMRPLVLTDGAKPLEAKAGQRLYWWHESFGWRPFGNAVRNWIPLSWRTEMAFKLESPGRMPRLIPVKTPYVHSSQKDVVLPEQIEIAVTPDDGGRRELRVTGERGPLAGVTVDVDLIDSLPRDRRVPLGVYRTGAGGRLVLDGEARQLVEVFVYRDGYEPARAVWEVGKPLTIRLRERATRVVFEELTAGQLVRIRPVDDPGSVRTLRGDAPNAKDGIRLAAGSYNTIVSSNQGKVVKSQRVEVVAGQREVRVSGAEPDQRPTLVVRFPDEGWRASVSEAVPAGMAVGWAITSTVGRSFALRDVDAEVVSQSASEQTFRLSRPGQIHLSAGTRDLAYTLWRQVELRAGATVTVEVPRGNATLRGSMRTYAGGIGFSHHGWAGPRMQLIAEDAERWSVTSYLPTRDKENKDSFTIGQLPAGTYFLNQHLIGEMKTYKSNDGKEHSYDIGRDAWGGIPVVLRAGETTTLPDFDDYKYAELAVRVQDRNGRPLEEATVRVRDRMSESWRVVEESPMTLGMASHAIPYPPAARIVKGEAKLPAIRAGRLEFAIEMDDGRVYPYRATVEEGKRLVVKVGR